MSEHDRATPRAGSDDKRPRLTEVVLGVHWDPPNGAAGNTPADLDALCVLYSSNDEVQEVIHPHNPRSSNASVVHTGDSRTGASTWDDERIFVFLNALPETVSKLAFLVVSASRHSFDKVPGAICHVSDRTSETEWVRIDLTSLADRTDCVVAILRRDGSAWRIETELHQIHVRLPVEVQSLLLGSKRTNEVLAFDPTPSYDRKA